MSLRPRPVLSPRSQELTRPGVPWAWAMHGTQGRPVLLGVRSFLIKSILFTICPLVLSPRCPRSPQVWTPEGGAVFVALSAHVQLLPKPQPPRVSEGGPPDELGPALAFSPPHQPTCISEAVPLAIWTGALWSCGCPVDSGWQSSVASPHQGADNAPCPLCRRGSLWSPGGGAAPNAEG